MYYFAVLLRIIIAPLIFIWPLPAIILSVFLDLIDADFAHKVISKKLYELIDKNLDLWWFINIIIYSYFNYPDYKIYLLILFTYRLIGQLIYYFSKNREVLLFFPNFFEWVFILIFLGKNYFPSILQGKTYFLISMAIFSVKIFQEWFLHVADLSIREDFLKIKRDWKK
ncbi:MAG: hypothetical protein WCT22_00940 [Patescibacteria group bacterium]|jgi:hypothetical protein